MSASFLAAAEARAVEAAAPLPTLRPFWDPRKGGRTLQAARAFSAGDLLVEELPIVRGRCSAQGCPGCSGATPSACEGSGACGWPAVVDAGSKTEAARRYHCGCRAFPAPLAAVALLPSLPRCFFVRCASRAARFCCASGISWW